MADAGEVIIVADSGLYPGGEQSVATDTYTPVIEVYTYLAGFMTTPAGGFEIVWTHPATGERLLVLAGDHVDRHVLALAREVAAASEVRVVTDSEACSAAEGQVQPLGVTVSVTGALSVSCEVLTSVPA
jgi:hypothetical protein